MAKKEITNQELAKNINDLANAVKIGFDSIDKPFIEFEGKINKRFNKLENGQEEIKLKLTNVAYRFELEEIQRKFELLTKRVKKLENKS